jgi:hypothetical protein
LEDGWKLHFRRIETDFGSKEREGETGGLKIKRKQESRSFVLPN